MSSDRRREEAERLVPPLGGTLHFRLLIGDEDLREALVARVMESPAEGFGFAVRAMLRESIHKGES